MREIGILRLAPSLQNKGNPCHSPTMRHVLSQYASRPRLLGDGWAYAVLAAAGFSFKAIFVKLAYAAGPVEPLTLLAMRMGIALPLFIWLAWASTPRNEPALRRHDLGRIVMLGCVGYYLSSLFDFYGLVHITAGLERMILYLYPTMVLLMQAWIARTAPSRSAWQGIALSYVGLAIAFVHDVQHAQGNVVVGSAWVFACAVTYAMYYVGTGSLVGRIGSARLAGLAGSASSLLVLAHFILFGNPASLLTLPAEVWMHAALMAVFSTVLPVWWLALAIRRMGAAHAAGVGTLGPVLTVIAAWLLLGESLSLLQLAGLALVLLGVMRLRPTKALPAAAAGTRD